ncbi:MAG: glycerol-3-phosphate dehydrogenase, partial [Gaiellales bacterium]|nr:glycerol-3-phosphate dehydrogenase [Gaiellales bacterium]
MSDSALSPASRKASLARIAAGERFDVVVVGGGITGVGIALDAASRGLSVALVEAGDIAGGTSSRSSKLIHGGLRYLEMLDFGLVREGLSERRLLRTRIAPHLVRPVPFLFPLRHRFWERPYLGSGLLLYDAMGGARHLPRSRHLSKRAALASAPALRPDSLVGAVRFYDCQEDDALYAAYVARTAAAQGAAIVTRARVTGFTRDESGRVTGVSVAGPAGELTLRARHTVSAAGVGSDRLLELATGEPQTALRPSKGVHLMVPR